MRECERRRAKEGGREGGREEGRKGEIYPWKDPCRVALPEDCPAF